LTTECGVCGFSMFDSNESTSANPHMTGDIIASYAKKHRKSTGHYDLQIEIDKRAPKQEIDVTVIVNE